MYKLLSIAVVTNVLLLCSCSNDNNEEVNKIEVQELSLDTILKIAIDRKKYALDLQQTFTKDNDAISIIQQFRKIDADFDSITRLYENFDLRQYDSLIWHPILYADEVNLDEDSTKEIIFIVGYQFSASELIVYDIVNDKLRKIGHEHIWMHNEYPEYDVYERNENNNIIKTVQFYGRGSGAWLKVNHYYKIIDSKLQVVFKAPASANASLGFSGIYILGTLLNDSLSYDNNEMDVSYRVNVEIDKRYIADTLKFEQVNVYEDEVFSAKYYWDDISKSFVTDDLDIAEYLININNDTCMFNFIKPKLEMMNTDLSRKYLEVYENGCCSIN